MHQWRRVTSPLFWLCISAIVGILLGDSLAQISKWWWLAGAAISLIWCWKSSARKLWKLCAACLLAFSFAQASAENDALRHSLIKRGERPILVTVVGMVDDAPQLSASGITWRFPLVVEALQGTSMHSTKLFVQLRSTEPPSYGDRLSIEGHLKQPTPSRNPGEFDWAEYLHRQGFSGELTVSSAASVQTLERTGGSWIRRSALESREWIAQAVTADLEDDAAIAATIRTMVLGTQESTPQDIEDAFVQSGTMHVFAVSGLHIVLFGLVLQWALRPLRVPNATLVAIIIPMMFFYVYITGLRPSAWRAAFMASIIFLGPLINRKGHIFTSLGFAALLLLGWDPQQLFQAGFQLSFGVVFMLALLTQPIMGLLEKYHQLEPYIPHGFHSRREVISCRWRKLFLESLVVSVAATIGSAPLMIHHFQLVTPIGIISNLFLVTLSSIILFVACLGILCAAIRLPLLSIWANNGNWLLAKSSIWFAKFFSSIPGGHIHVDPAHWLDRSTARVSILSFQEGGAATLIESEGRKWMLDSGPAASFLFVQRPFLLRYPLSAIDGMLLTHHDTAHIGAASVITSNFPSQRMLVPPKLKTVIPSESALSGTSISLNPHGKLNILYPPEEMLHGLADDQCVVAMLEVDGWKLLFTSDSGFIAEKWLLEHQIDIKADVWIKGHHTDDFSGLPEFANAVKPQAVIFTNSRFPADQFVPPDWIQMIESKGIKTIDQGKTGAVAMSISQNAVSLEAFITKEKIVLRK